MGIPDSPSSFAAFQQFHEELLSRAPTQGSWAGAVADAAPLGAVTFTTPLGSATWQAHDSIEITVTATGETIPLDPSTPHTTVDLPIEAWWGLMCDYETVPGLLISGRASVSSGKPGRATRWEAPLRAILHDIPVYNEATIDLRDRHGAALDPSRSFTLTEIEQDPETAVHFLTTAGFMAVRSVFTPEEVQQFQEAVDQLAAEATEGDQASWWGKNTVGDSLLTRVLRGYTRPVLRALVDDPRVRTIIDCYGEHMEVPIPDELDGVTVIYKRPDMVEGLADLPWHRDCGMGGHGHMCPSLVMSIYVTPGTPATGELRVLPGSHRTSAPFLDERTSGEIGVGVPMQPGDVSLHITDVMHASMPPTASEGPHRIAVLLPFTRPVPSTHLEGVRHYNDALLGSEDGQVARLGG